MKFCRPLFAGCSMFFLGMIQASAALDTPNLPIGSWGHIEMGKPLCSRPEITIEPNQIIERSGKKEYRCKITAVQKDGGNILGSYECFGKNGKKIKKDSIDEEDGAFAIAVESPDRIIYNSGGFGRCN